LRKITQDATRHNAAPNGFALFAHFGLIVMFLAVPILFLAACSKDAGTEGKPSAKPADQSSDCSLTTDISAWTAFKDISDRIASGEDVTKEQLDAFGDQSSVVLWRNSLQPGVPSALRIGNWLEGTFWEELGRSGKQKMSSNRFTFIRSYRFSVDNRVTIDERLAELTGPRKCEIAELADYWIESGLLPRPVAIHFLPAKAEIRVFEGSLLVDTGVVGAASVDQVIRNMAALLYRKYQAMPGPDPMEVEGDEAVANAFRVLMNEGLIGWIEQAVTLEFNSGHPVLHKVKIIPEDFYLKTQETIAFMNRRLPSMLDDEATMADGGQAFARYLAGMNAYSSTGYGMSAVIAARLGVDRLRKVRLSVPAFLAAYQEAASANPVPAPVPGAPDTELFLTVPPLDPDIFTKLHEMLTRVFPD
jgi:hypothetical protein